MEHVGGDGPVAAEPHEVVKFDVGELESSSEVEGHVDVGVGVCVEGGEVVGSVDLDLAGHAVVLVEGVGEEGLVFADERDVFVLDEEDKSGKQGDRQGSYGKYSFFEHCDGSGRHKAWQR